MKLLTKELEKKFRIVAELSFGNKKLYDKDPFVIAKYFHPFSNGTWFATEYNPEEKMFFGFVTGISRPEDDEWGYFSILEFEKTKIHGLGFERDLHFGHPQISEVPEIKKIQGFHRPLQDKDYFVGQASLLNDINRELTLCND